MSSPPNKYIKSHDYAADNANLNVDFDRIKSTTDQTIDRLALIQRDDGALRDGAITENSIADGAVSTSKLKDAAVTEPKLANLSVSNRTLLDLVVTTSKLALLAVGTGQLSDAAVTQAKLGLLSVGTPQLIDAAITSPKLGPSLNFTGVPTAPTALTGTNTTQLATTAFVAASMSAAGMITEAPNDGKLYGRLALGWQRGVALAGDTMTGPLTVPSLTATGAINGASLALTGNLTAVDGTFSGALNSKSLGVRYDVDGPSASYHVNQSAGVAARSGWLAFNGTSYGGVLHYGANYNTVAGDSAKPNGTLITGSGAGGLNFEASAAGAGMEWWTNFTKRMTLNIGGNLALGTTTPAWDAGTRALSIGSGLTLSAGTNPTSASGSMTVNTYYDGANHKYITANAAQLLNLANGNCDFYNAPVGAIGAVATYTLRMRLDGNGALAINSPGAPANCFLDAWGSANGTVYGRIKNTFGGSGAAGAMSAEGNSAAVITCQMYANEYVTNGNLRAQGGVLYSNGGGGLSLISGGGGTTINASAGGIAGGTYLAAGATAWAALSSEASKRDLRELGDPFHIINNHRVRAGRYVDDPDDAPERPFLFFEDTERYFPLASAYVPARDLEATDSDGKNPVTIYYPEIKGISLELYVPLLMLAMQRVDARLKAGGL